MDPAASGEGTGGLPITYGQPRRALRLGDLIVTETRHRAGTRLPAHEHEAEDVTGIVIEVPRQAQERLGLIALFRDRRRLVDGDCAGLATRIALALRSASTLPRVEGLVHELFAALALRPATGPRPAWLERVRDAVTWDPSEGGSLERVAAAVGRHPSHVAREFRRHFGRSIGDYARTRRIEEAATALRDGERPIAEIALRAGFCDQSHFTHAFRRALGITPAEYRRALARSPDRSPGTARDARRTALSSIIAVDLVAAPAVFASRARELQFEGR